jgi:hypothetical protein
MRCKNCERMNLDRAQAVAALALAKTENKQLRKVLEDLVKQVEGRSLSIYPLDHFKWPGMLCEAKAVLKKARGEGTDESWKELMAQNITYRVALNILKEATGAGMYPDCIECHKTVLFGLVTKGCANCGGELDAIANTCAVCDKRPMRPIGPSRQAMKGE